MKNLTQEKEKKENKLAVNRWPTRKSPAEKATARENASPAGGLRPTRISAVIDIDIGSGNKLYIRGAGSGLSWDRGALMENLASNQWTWTQEDASMEIHCKFLINDKTWLQSELFIAKAGTSSVFTPSFQ